MRGGRSPTERVTRGCVSGPMADRFGECATGPPWLGGWWDCERVTTLKSMPIGMSRLLHIVALAVLIAGPVGGIWPASLVEAGGPNATRDDAAVYQHDDAPPEPPAVPGGVIIPPDAPSPRGGNFQVNAIGPW